MVEPSGRGSGGTQRIGYGREVTQGGISNGKYSKLVYGHQHHRRAGGSDQHHRTGAEESHLGETADEHPGGGRLDGTHTGGVLRLLPDQGHRGGVVYGRRRNRTWLYGFVCSHVRL